jgi:hypothetical protein
MSIKKKSLISTLKATKKANIIKEHATSQPSVKSAARVAGRKNALLLRLASTKCKIQQEERDAIREKGRFPAAFLFVWPPTK